MLPPAPEYTQDASIDTPDQVIELDRVATDAERGRDAMPPLPKTAPDPNRDTEGFAAEYAAMDAAMDAAMAKLKDLRIATRIDSAVAAAVEEATSEHHARVREMKAELAQMRDFDTQVLKDNHRLREENALLLGR